jgi:hypothetical protein
MSYDCGGVGPTELITANSHRLVLHVAKIIVTEKDDHMFSVIYFTSPSPSISTLIYFNTPFRSCLTK